MTHGSIIAVIADLDAYTRSPTSVNPPNCTNDPNMFGNAIKSTKEAIAEFTLEPIWQLF